MVYRRIARLEEAFYEEEVLEVVETDEGLGVEGVAVHC